MKGDVQPVEVVLQTVLHFSLEAVGGSSVREKKGFCRPLTMILRQPQKTSVLNKDLVVVRGCSTKKIRRSIQE